MVTLENLQIGMVFTITEEGERRGWGPRESIAVIRSTKINGSGEVAVGMDFEVSHNAKYHDLDGMVKFGHGYWLTPNRLLSESSFILLQEKIVLKPGIKLKEKDIGNKQGRILKYFFRTEYVMVELSENVEGCSGDGLGKAGHCVILEKNKINFEHTNPGVRQSTTPNSRPKVLTVGIDIYNRHKKGE